MDHDHDIYHRLHMETEAGQAAANLLSSLNEGAMSREEWRVIEQTTAELQQRLGQCPGGLPGDTGCPGQPCQPAGWHK